MRSLKLRIELEIAFKMQKEAMDAFNAGGRAIHDM